MINTDQYKPRLEEYLQKKGIDTSNKKITCIDPNHADSDPSMTIYDERVNCNSCGFKGDIFDCAGAFINSSDFVEQLKEVQKVFGDQVNTPKAKARSVKKAATKFISLPRKEALNIYTEEKILEMAEFVTKKKLKIPGGGWYPYYNADELIDLMVVRFLHDSGKDILTFYWDGKHIKMKAYPVLLYNRHHLIQRPDDPVIIHEGEKCANLGTDKLKKFVHTTWNGGGKKYKNIQELDILSGREIYLLADDDQKMDKISKQLLAHNDQPGQKTMIELKTILEKI